METTDTIDETPAPPTDTEAENGETTERRELTLDDDRAHVVVMEARRDRLQEQRAEKAADLQVARRALDAQYANEGSAETIAELEARIQRLETSIKGIDGGLVLVDQDLSTARQLVRAEEIAEAEAAQLAARNAYRERISELEPLIRAFVRELLDPVLDEAMVYGRDASTAWQTLRRLQGRSAGPVSPFEVPNYQLTGGALREIVEHLQKFASGATLEQQNSRMAEQVADFSRRIRQERRETDARQHAEALELMKSSARCLAVKRQHKDESDGGRRAAYLEARYLIDEIGRAHV